MSVPKYLNSISVSNYCLHCLMSLIIKHRIIIPSLKISRIVVFAHQNPDRNFENQKAQKGESEEVHQWVIKFCCWNPWSIFTLRGGILLPQLVQKGRNTQAFTATQVHPIHASVGCCSRNWMALILLNTNSSVIKNFQ